MSQTCRRAVILCHGTPPSAALLQRHLAGADLVICTDGAAAWAQDHGCPVQVVLGDMDSLTRPLPGAEMVNSGPHEVQENSDAEKALRYALQQGAREVVLLGATGGRLDHTLANVALVVAYADRAEVSLADDTCQLWVVRGRRELPAPPGTMVSLLALEPDTVVRTEGLCWPLDEPLALGTRGLSNRVQAAPVVVEAVKGSLLAMVLEAEVKGFQDRQDNGG